MPKPAPREGRSPEETPDPLAWLNAEALSVPMLPSTAHRVIELASGPDVTIPRLAAVVSKDQVLASQVLRLANSAYSAPAQPISTVTQALVRLGTGAVRNVIITVSLNSRMQDAAFCETRGRALSDHAVGTAYVARLIAEQVRVNQDEAFLVGLLHDIGKLVILRLAHDHRARTRRPVPEAVLAQALKECHAELGALVLRQWKLPESLDAPVLFHHDYAAAGERVREAAVAYCANFLAHRYGFGCPPDPTDPREDPAFTFLDLDEPWLEATDARAPGLFRVAREILQ